MYWEQNGGTMEEELPSIEAKDDSPWTALDNQGKVFEIFCADNVELVFSELGIKWCSLHDVLYIHCSCARSCVQTKYLRPYFTLLMRAEVPDNSAPLGCKPGSASLLHTGASCYWFFLIMGFQWYFLSNQNLMKCNSKAWISWVRGFTHPGCSMKAWGTNPIWL